MIYYTYEQEDNYTKTLKWNKSIVIEGFYFFTSNENDILI